MTDSKVSSVIARRSQSNRRVFQNNGGEVVALSLVARNDGGGEMSMSVGVPTVYGVFVT